MKFFSIDSPLYKFMCQLFDILKLNMLWILCSIPVITIGASTTAAFHVALQMVDDEEGYIGREFMKSFKRNLVQGSVMGIMTLVGVYAVWLDLQLCRAKEYSLGFVLVTVMLIAFMILGNIYAYALLARYDNTIRETFQNSFMIAIRYFIPTVVLVVLIAIEVIIIMWNLTTYFVGFLIGPACIIYTISATAKKHFHILEEMQEESGENTSDDLKDEE